MNELDLLTKILDVLNQIEGWNRFSNSDALRVTLEGELKEVRKKIAYEATDGGQSMRDVASASGVPVTTVQGWWSRWLALGIVNESPSRKGRMIKICSLRDLGIDIPKS